MPRPKKQVYVASEKIESVSGGTMVTDSELVRLMKELIGLLKSVVDTKDAIKDRDILTSPIEYWRQPKID